MTSASGAWRIDSPRSSQRRIARRRFAHQLENLFGSRYPRQLTARKWLKIGRSGLAALSLTQFARLAAASLVKTNHDNCLALESNWRCRLP